MSFRRLLKTVVLTVGVAAVSMVGVVSAAYAAGGGYGTGTPTTPTGTGAYSQVVSVQTASPAGGTFVATVDGVALSVTIPPGEFTVPTQLVFTTGSLTQIRITGISGTVTSVFGIQFDQGGTKLAGTLPRSVSVTVKNPSITSSSVVYEEGIDGFAPAPGWTASAGQVTGSITSDPNFAVASSTSGSAAPGATVPGATNPVTGEPFIGMGLIAGGLVVAGGLGFWWSRRRLHTVA